MYIKGYQVTLLKGLSYLTWPQVITDLLKSTKLHNFLSCYSFWNNIITSLHLMVLVEKKYKLRSVDHFGKKTNEQQQKS